MKEHLKSYFPQRFEDSDTFKLNRSAISMLSFKYDEVRDTAKCEEKVAQIFSKSNELKLLVGALKRYGCNFDLSRHVVCEKCNNCDAGFDPDTYQIVMCSNRYKTKDMLMTSMMHEMIHMFDYCRAQFDFNNLEHIACSEVSSFAIDSFSIYSEKSEAVTNYLRIYLLPIHC